MSLRNIDMVAAMRRLAERRIEEAIEEGKFDNLAGMGEPLDLEPMPAGEDARLTWWCLRIMKQNDFTPHELRWRKAVDALREALANARNEPDVRALVRQINKLIGQINTLGTNAMRSGMASLDEGAEMQRWRERNKRGGSE